jgi:ketosteroid isomerase-like protein
MNRCGWLTTVGLILAAMGQAAEDPKTVESQLRAVVLSNFVASAREDVNAVRATLHPQSPVFKSSLHACQQVFDYYDLQYELLSFRYLLADGDYAVARGRQKTTKTEGEPFKDNLMDCLYVFKRDAGEWKLWQQTVLETQYLTAKN